MPCSSNSFCGRRDVASVVHDVCEVFEHQSPGPAAILSAILDCTKRQLTEIPTVRVTATAAAATQFRLNQNGIVALPETAFAGMSTLK